MNVDIIYILMVISVILISMTFHEAMHGFASYWLGDDTAKDSGRLSLNPIKHIDPFLTIILPVTLAIVGGPIFGGAKPVPFNPRNLKWGEWGIALVGLAGPLTNFIIAFIFFAILIVLNLPAESVSTQFLSVGVMVNLGFFIFNMIPIPPLDGSRVLYALAPDFVRGFMEQLEGFGVLIIFSVLLLAGESFSRLFLGAIEFFVVIFSHILSFL